MNFNRKFVAGCTLLALSCGAAQSAELALGAPACKSQQALLEYIDAVQKGDLNTVEWLRGAACMLAPREYAVRVLEETPSGEVRFKATIQRRQATLWTSATSLNP